MLIEKALSYEDLLYKADVKNWSDQREAEDGIKYDDLENNIPVAWCHGASGILLSRLYLYKMNLPITAERKKKIWLDINNAVETSLKIWIWKKSLSLSWRFRQYRNFKFGK